jgi:hypothetical protein
VVALLCDPNHPEVAMLYVLLLVIIAILLVGSSRVLGAVGLALGYICLAAALGLLTYFAAPWLISLGLNSDQVPWVIVLFFIGLLVVARLAAHLHGKRK